MKTITLTTSQLEALEILAEDYSVADDILAEINLDTRTVNLKDLDGEAQEWLLDWVNN